MSAEPRYQRRKEDRPREIADAAFEIFAEKGYTAARIDDVAKRAGVSKGLTYLYYKTKEELFKAVIKNVVVRRVDTLVDVLNNNELPVGEFLRGPMLKFLQSLPGSPVATVIRLLIAEGPRHPDLLSYYYDNVIAKGLAAIRQFIERAVERGELRPEATLYQPQLILAPVMMSVIWRLLFANRSLDTDQLIESQIDLFLARLAVTVEESHEQE